MAGTGVTLIDIVHADDARLQAFYDLYSRIFTLSEEREPIEGFRTVLRLSHDKTVAREFGPLSERITLAIDNATGAVAGATNFIYYGFGGGWDLYDVAGSCQLNFICVDQAHRTRGIAPLLLRDMEEKLAAFAREKVPQSHGYLFITCEQNNPHRMTPDQLSADIRDSGMQPNDRLAWWMRRGYRRLDFSYRQPPLNASLKACTYLDYYIRFPDNKDRATLPAAILAEHLRRFFFVSVGKLEIDMNANPEWIAQRDALAARQAIAVVCGDHEALA